MPKMNVLKEDFMSKQKRLQGRRQKVIKTFFSGYHTISNIPSVSRVRLPVNNEDNVRNQLKSSPRFPFSFADIEESVKQKSGDTYSTNTTTNQVDEEQGLELRGVRDSTTSTSVEFHKILEPFLSFKQEYVADTSEEQFEKNIALRGKIFPNHRAPDTKYLDSIFDSEETAGKNQSMLQFTPRVFPVDCIGSNKNTFEQYNIYLHCNKEKEDWWGSPGDFVSLSKCRPVDVKICGSSKNYSHCTEIFNLPVPKNQRSIDEVLNVRSDVRRPISEEVTRSPSSISRNSTSHMKTPMTKGRKSPKVSSSSRTATSDSGTFILAVTEGRGHARGEVGIAAMDPKRPHLVLCQISDSQSYAHSLTKMNVFDLAEVIVPNTFVDSASPNKLYSDIRATFPKVTLTSVQRRHFNESIGLDFIRQYSSSESNSVMVLLRDKFYALSAAAALIKYIEFTQNVRLAPQSLRIEYQGMEDTMIIDLNTANLLELVLCVNHPETNSNHSLLGVINYCHTKGGVRLLRANLLQPPCSLIKIETRLESVTELINAPLLLCALEAAVSSFSNLEDLLNLCMHAPQQDGLRAAEYQLKYTLLLKTMLELLPTLSTCLNDTKSEFFREVRKNLEDPRYYVILERVRQSVFENAKTVKGSVAAHLHGCFAIKTGINSLLDIAKKTYCEIVQEISDHVANLRENHNMPLRLAFSANKGFHIQYTLPPGQRNLTEISLPKQFILAQKSKTSFSFYTAELVALDQRSQHVLDEIKLMTNVILFELLTDIRQHIGCLFNLCEYVAELDVLISFAHVGSGTNYVRPKFGERLELKASRHPILDVIYDGEVVPNDAFAESGKNFTILTGPNQSGKSIYIRQIALLQVMAQMGCYVPAKEATFRLTDRIFSRISFDDSIESNASTLIVEMRDIEYLKQNKTPRSLVIIDELCRGTSVEEGTSLAFAICEELLDTSTFVFFTTHYLFLTKLEEMYFNVTNYHFESVVETEAGGKPSMRFTHQRKAGATTADSYGLQVAEITSFPKDVYGNAKKIAAQLSKDRKPRREVNGLLAEYELSLRLRNELRSEMSWQKMESIIRHFKELYRNIKKDVTTKRLHSGEESSGSWNGVSGEGGTAAREEKENSPCLVGRIGRAKRGQRSKEPVSGARIPKNIAGNEGEKSKTEIVLKMATSIRKKYRKLVFERKRLQRRVASAR